MTWIGAVLVVQAPSQLWDEAAVICLPHSLVLLLECQRWSCGRMWMVRPLLPATCYPAPPLPLPFRSSRCRTAHMQVLIVCNDQTVKKNFANFDPSFSFSGGLCHTSTKIETVLPKYTSDGAVRQSDSHVAKPEGRKFQTLTCRGADMRSTRCARRKSGVGAHVR